MGIPVCYKGWLAVFRILRLFERDVAGSRSARPVILRERPGFGALDMCELRCHRVASLASNVSGWAGSK